MSAALAGAAPTALGYATGDVRRQLTRGGRSARQRKWKPEWHESALRAAPTRHFRCHIGAEATTPAARRDGGCPDDDAGPAVPTGNDRAAARAGGVSSA